MPTTSEAPSAPDASPVRSPQGLSIVTGIFGLLAALGAAPSGFLDFYADRRVTDFAWGSTMQFAFVFALIGSVLALASVEFGPPMVVGASSVIVAVVGTTMISELNAADALDEYPVRALLFYAGGIAGAVAIAAGFASLRGTPERVLGAGIAVLAALSLVGVVVLARLDQDLTARQLRPLVGFTVISAIAAVGGFVGRYGALIAATSSSILIPLFISFLDRITFREWAIQLSLSANIGALVLALVAAIVATRRVPASRPLAPLTYPTDHIVITSTVPEPEPTAPGGPSSPVSSVSQWAPDPYGRHQLRYWNGSRWTDHVSSNGISSLDPI
jgi:Protein of unknown function (DUF2510)